MAQGNMQLRIGESADIVCFKLHDVLPGEDVEHMATGDLVVVCAW